MINQLAKSRSLLLVLVIALTSIFATQGIEAQVLYPPLNFQGSIPPGTDYAHLTWDHPDNGAPGGGLPDGIMGYNLYRNDTTVAFFIVFPANEYFDLNLPSGIYTYYLSAVYDLSAYGFPGETGESMKQGPVQLDFTYWYYLPLAEDFYTGSFETNEWTVDSENWRISGASGNDAPSAEFYHSPVVTYYSQALTSHFISGNDFIDGGIVCDFDIKLNTTYNTGTEFLVVEVLKGSYWIKIAEYCNTASFDWKNESIIINSLALGSIFQVRFRAYGTNSVNIDNWLVDNIQVYRECKPPYNFNIWANPNNIPKVWLRWQHTITYDNQWLHWDDGMNHDAVGLNGGGTFSAASRFPVHLLKDHAGSSLTKIRFFPVGTEGIFTLKVWRDQNASELAYSQLLDSYTPNMWNEVVLEPPVFILPDQELWFGYTLIHNDNLYPAGVDKGPADRRFGDMISLDGVVWESLNDISDIDGNWNLQGFIENEFTAKSGQLSLLQHSLSEEKLNKSERNLRFFNIYRDGILIDSTELLEYFDPLPPSSPSRCYTVTAVYSDCESPPSEEDCYYATNISTDLTKSANKIYPNPSGDLINMELTSDIKQLMVYNSMGQVVYEQEITGDKNVQLDVKSYKSGPYLLKLITHNGECVVKKIAVVH